MVSKTLVQCLWASVLLLLPISDARASPRNFKHAVQPRASGWTYSGCYVDTVGARTLTTNPATKGGTAALTVELCESTCLGLGFSIAGVEYGGECYCGSKFSNGGGPAPDGEAGCNMQCNGNATETCGGSNRLSVWSYGTLAVVSSSATHNASSSVLSTSTSKFVSIKPFGRLGSPLSTSKSVTSSSAATKSTSKLISSTKSIVSSTKTSTLRLSTSSSKISSSQSSSAASSPSKPALTTSVTSARSKLTSVSVVQSSPSKSTSVSSVSLTTVHSGPSSSVSKSSSKTGSLTLSSSSSSKSSSSVISTSSPLSTSSVLSTSSTSSPSIVSSTLVPSTKLSSSSVAYQSSSQLSSSPQISSLASSTTLVSSSSVLSTKSASSTQIQPPGWVSFGCYTDAVGARALTNQIWTIPGASVTIEACEAACHAGGWSLSGVEYADECYCGTSISNGNTLATDGGCNMACTGNTTEICGGPNRVSVYSYSLGGVVSSTTASTSITSATSSSISTSATAVPGWTSIGCYTDVVGARTLTTEIYSIPGSAMTVELCTAACKAGGFTLAGVEYGGECYCDNAIENTGAPATDGRCSMPCNGNAAEICGGSYGVNVYSLGLLSSSSSVASSATSTSSTTSASTVTSTSSSSSAVASSTTSAASVATSLPKGWAYKGCWLDQQYGRILGYTANAAATLTIESCVQQCTALGYSIAGMEYFTQCYCGNALINQAVTAPETDCNTACGGNATEFCGGPDRMSIYSNETTLVITPVPHTQTAGLPGSWNYTGCLSDNAVARTFPYQIEMLTNNTAAACLTQCQTFGYGAGGMEFGEQCFCGDVANVVAAGATLQDESSCNMVCTGNDSYICGGSSRISYYTWIGTPLNSWDFPTGAAAGEYQFLIGGVMTPLIATAGVNGKINFLEKSGTEPVANSTGAYELDLALMNNFTAAWRPLHVKTDIFCSAGLTLPDKVGRQINIGGWANDATYGVRLYWPDGKPGVWGVNDWQENVLEVHLQAGRWYPTAMMMTNGSILVVGGEEGSNGAPVPSLEILPLPAGAGTVYCDWLDRTDPYNLYPFLAVLPSGGVVALYYNEARILDEVSLQTQRVLPNMPGAVNDFLGGRTYPFEGTSMLFPQHAPYTDPLTVIVCGGSVPGPEIALDNCVSIQPEVPNANWTIERMPSKRVISCICALPDGTYLIMNGAQQGRAGFGLATEPNLNAVLYNPSKPVNSRMSVMANTTVARLYHSEAILLLDGRVLVSGSDPEDVRFPQEYRVEVFVPPYLLSGAKQPTYTLSSTDLAYGEKFTVTVNLFQGTTATMKISLLAAVSSTHGNSMGQRTIFPAFTCVGNVCTVTAPPNAHVSPPAWHMLFVLDGPTPSVAQWVRIGGDPAGLGNWPNYPDFNIPGI